jgi:hypothetical protein
VLAHAPLFPGKKFERWVVVMADETGRVYGWQNISSLREQQVSYIGQSDLI